MIKYSFIVPVYNGEKYLKNCIESILNQNTEVHFEVILVDDGSTDSSADICRSFEDEYDCVKYIYKENGGAASARNIGIDAAKGDYIIFVDDDDTIECALLGDIEALTCSSDMIIYGMSFDHYSDSKLLRSESLSCKHSGVKPVSEICSQFQEYFNDNALSSACNKVFKAELIRDNDLRFKEGMTLYEDLEFVMRYMMNSESVTLIDKAYYHYRILSNAGNLADRTSNICRLKENMSLLLDCINDLAAREEVSGIRFFGLQLYLDMLHTHFRFADVSEEKIKKDAVYYLDDIEFDAEDDRSRWLIEGEYDKYYHDLRKRKRNSAVKQAIKKVIGK